MSRITADLLYNFYLKCHREKADVSITACTWFPWKIGWFAARNQHFQLPEARKVASCLENTAVSLHLGDKRKIKSVHQFLVEGRKNKTKDKTQTMRLLQSLTSFVERTESSSRLRTASVRMTSWGKKRRLIVWKEEKQGLLDAKCEQWEMFFVFYLIWKHLFFVKEPVTQSGKRGI